MSCNLCARVKITNRCSVPGAWIRCCTKCGGRRRSPPPVCHLLFVLDFCQLCCCSVGMMGGKVIRTCTSYHWVVKKGCPANPPIHRYTDTPSDPHPYRQSAKKMRVTRVPQLHARGIVAPLPFPRVPDGGRAARSGKESETSCVSMSVNVNMRPDLRR